MTSTVEEQIENTFEQLFLSEYPKEAARELEKLETKDAAILLAEQPIATVVNIWHYLAPSVTESILFLFTDNNIKILLEKLDAGISASLISRFENTKQQQLLSILDPKIAYEIKELMVYPENTAGNLMEKKMIAFNQSLSVKEAIDQLKKQKIQALKHIYLLNDDGILIGQVNMQRIALADNHELLSSLAIPVKAYVNALDPKSDAIALFEKYHIDTLPVLDANSHLVGSIQGEDILENLREDIASEMQTMVGVSKDESANSTSFFAVRKRLPWLQINLLTAFLAAAVVGLFEGTIAKYTALAVLLPIAAGQSGNAGAQALAVTMRGLTLREITMRNWLKITFKEMSTGFLNGCAVAITCGLGIYIWSKSFGLALIMAIAMIVSMTIAGVAGGLVPLMLKRFGLDPAQSSSIVLTTITDIAGFMSFLGIATLLSSLIT